MTILNELACFSVSDGTTFAERGQACHRTSVLHANWTSCTVTAQQQQREAVDPMGNIEEKGIAYWNLDFGQLMPGSQVYVPISSELFSNKLKQLNERVAALAVHRVLPQ